MSSCLINFDLIIIFALLRERSLSSLVLVVIALLAMLIGFLFFIKSVINRQKKGELMKEKIMPEIASKFGKIISAPGGGTILDSNNTIIFERENTMFEAKIIRVDLGNRFTSPKIDYEVRFNLPNLQQSFYIQSKPNFFKNFSKYSLDSQPIPAIPADDVLYTSRSQFLESLLEKKQITAEIYKYLNIMSNGFRIAFENNEFIITWNFGIVENSPIEAEKLEQICQTAVVFYDELSDK